MLFRYSRLAPKKILVLLLVLVIAGISVMLAIDTKAAEIDPVFGDGSDTVSFYDVETSKVAAALKNGLSSYVNASVGVLLTILEAEEEAEEEAIEESLAIAAEAAQEKADAAAEEEAEPTAEELRAELVEYALSFVGSLQYVYGGTSLTYGVDCSGFTMAIYEAFGYTLPHNSAAQRSCGTSVSYADAQPGDILVFRGHVGIYIGDGKMVHAENTYTDVTVSYVYSGLIDVRRIIE